jgi:arsenite methyltransferase
MNTPTGSSEEAIRNRVRDGYAAIAVDDDKARRSTAMESDCCGPGSCCGPAMSKEELATRIGYESAELEKLPGGANLGLSCGNPTAIAELAQGETVVDLGSGAGFDCFLAGPKVGEAGRVIGVDMTAEMLTKARGNVPSYRDQTGLDNVEFRLGEIEHLPVENGTVDVLISNCVINLSPNKAQVYREIARVLKPGGRIAVSDIALLKPLPEAVAREALTWVGCVAGADTIDAVRSRLKDAGLTDISLEPQPDYVATMESMNDPLYVRITELLPQGERPHDYITSLEIRARRTL